MKYILNKKNISIIIYVILALLFTNTTADYQWDNNYSFEWLENQIIPTNYRLAYKVKEKAGLSEFDNYRYYFSEDITDEQLTSILNNNETLFKDSFILDDPNIKYIIKDHETGTVVTNTTDITSINEKNYDGYYLYFVTFMFDENGLLSYNTSEKNGFDWYDNLSSYKSNYLTNIEIEIDEYLNNSSIYNSDLKNLKNMTITYAITFDLASDCESYYYLHPQSELQVYMYEEIKKYILLIGILSFIISYDKLWFYNQIKKYHPLISLGLLSTIYIMLYYLPLQHSIRYIYYENNHYIFFIYVTLIFYLTHLISTYIRYLFNTYKPITKFKSWLDKYLPNKTHISDNDAININEITQHINISKSHKITFIFVSILSLSIIILSFVVISFIDYEFIILMIICLFICLYLICYKYINEYIKQYTQLSDAIKKLSQGYFDNNIKEDLSYFKDIQEDFSHIKDGFEKAVLEEVKSERMKTELITNVSHDLKTPLTSIITYIDLLKNENNPDNQKNYLNILERSSLRLKRLIEDLFEVSKANSGNIELNIETIDIVSLIKQVQFEYKDKFDTNALTIKENFSKDKYILQLDSLKTFRIFENIFNNASKYAMPNTRIYIDINEDDYYVTVTIKNISYQEMNFNGDEIVERFVRGDKSRNTTGSGLGLAIVKSFVEVQNGEFKVNIDGDLFKAIVKFKK